MKFYQSLSHDLTELYEDNTYCDVSIETGQAPNNKTFRAHSLILNYRSSYFRKVLSRKSIDGKTKFRLNVSPVLFQIMLKYIYTGVLSLEDQDTYGILNLLVIIDKFGLQELVKQLQLHLLEHHTVWLRQNYYLIYKASFQHETFQELQKFCTDIASKTPGIIFQSQDFTSIQENFLISLLQCENLGMKEIQIWNHIIRWGIEQNPSFESDPTYWSTDEFRSLEKTLSRLLPLIKYFQFTSQEFYDKVRPYKRILSPKLYEDLKRHYMKPSINQSSSNISPHRRYASSDNNTPKKDFSLPSSPNSRTNSRPNTRPNTRPNSPAFVLHQIPDSRNLPGLRTDDIDSELITLENANLISNWIGLRNHVDFAKSPFEFRLIFRASIDGFAPINFHKKCDDKQSTLVVIKVRGTGEIIGGYNPISWKPLKGSWGNTESSFIFSLRGQNLKGPIFSRLIKGQNTYALNYKPNLGPSFGIADLKIEGSDFKNECKCYCMKGCYEKGIRPTTGFFSIEDYEVFQILKKPI